MAKRLCLDPTAGASSDSSSSSAGASSAGASSSFDSASTSSSASSSGDYTLVCQCGYVTSVPHPLTRYFNFLGKTLEYSLVHNMTLVRASRRERREHQFVNYPASVSVGERWSKKNFYSSVAGVASLQSQCSKVSCDW